MKLFIANCTKQNTMFLYRLPEEQTIRRQDIPAGGQIQVLGDTLTQTACDFIIEHHRRYGLVALKELDRIKNAFVGLCFSIEKPVPVEKIMHAAEHNDVVLDAASIETRKVAAASLSELLHGQDNPNVALDGITIETIEEERKGENKSTIKEKITVAKEGSRVAQRAGEEQSRNRR